MIHEYGDLLGNLSGMQKFTEDFIRVLPSLSLDYTNPKACPKPVPKPLQLTITLNLT